MDKDKIREQLVQDIAYFKKAINLIPVNFYFDEHTKKKLFGIDNQDDTSEKHGRSSKKRNKYDPEQMKCVSDLQEMMEADQDKTAKKLKSGAEYPDELKERLHNKLDELRAKRKASKFQETHKRKNSKKELKKLRTTKKHVEKNRDSNGITPSKKPKPASNKPIYNKEGNIVFSKFDFTDSGIKEKKSGVATGKNYKKLLEKVQRDKDHIEKIAETDETKAKKLAEKQQWMSALNKAEGIKVKDNPELLKKSLKKKEKVREQRKKAWDKRESQVNTRIKEKQDKRKANIDKRKHEKAENKIKKAKKKGRIIGF